MFDARKLLTDIMGGGKANAGEGGSTDPLADIGGLIGSVFGQAKDGIREGAAEIEKRTGIGQKAGDAVESATGSTAGDLFKRAKDFAGQNKLATGAAIGGLGALLLGTRTGRGMAGNAATLGGLALIGGLAYKAYKNHSEGKPILDTPEQKVLPAPDASPFGESGDDDTDQTRSMLILRAMIAAAASDGAIDNAERSRIVGGLEDAGMDVMAAKFLDGEFANPASAADIAAAATTLELKMEVYTAARVGMDAPSPAEGAFLADLASKLGLSADQVAHMEATVAQVKTS